MNNHMTKEFCFPNSHETMAQSFEANMLRLLSLLGSARTSSPHFNTTASGVVCRWLGWLWNTAAVRVQHAGIVYSLHTKRSLFFLDRWSVRNFRTMLDEPILVEKLYNSNNNSRASVAKSGFSGGGHVPQGTIKRHPRTWALAKNASLCQLSTTSFRRSR